MKKYLLVLGVIIAISCKKDNIDLYYDSEIFKGDDLQIYGKWEYVYTITGGGVAGSYSKSDEKLPTLVIKPFGRYENVVNHKILESGKINIVGNLNTLLLIQLCPNGLNSNQQKTQLIHTQQPDSLIIGQLEMEWADVKHYKRVN